MFDPREFGCSIIVKKSNQPRGVHTISTYFLLTIVSTSELLVITQHSSQVVMIKLIKQPQTLISQPDYPHFVKWSTTNNRRSTSINYCP